MGVSEAAVDLAVKWAEAVPSAIRGHRAKASEAREEVAVVTDLAGNLEAAVAAVEITFTRHLARGVSASEDEVGTAATRLREVAAAVKIEVPSHEVAMTGPQEMRAHLLQDRVRQKDA